MSLSESLPQAVAPVSGTKSAHQQRPALVGGAGIVAMVDSLSAVFAIVFVLITVNLSKLPGTLETFLSARVTVKNLLLLILLATVWPLVYQVFGLYDARKVRRLESEVSRLLFATIVGSGVAFAFPLTSASGRVTVWDVPRFWMASFALGLLVRAGRRAVEHARSSQVRRTLIVGTGRLARRAAKDIRLGRFYGNELVGFVDDEHAESGSDVELVGTIDDLERILMRQVIDEVIVALPVKSRYQQMQRVIEICEHAGVRATYGADMFQSVVAVPRYDSDGDRAVVAMQVVPDGYRLVIKRAIDIVGAIAGLVLLAPLLLLVAALIKLTSRGPVIFAQDRCGLAKRRFRMYKFRSMTVDADQKQADYEHRNEADGPVFKIRDDPRITPLGRFLRKSSIDELPQLWNVLKGDMSLVGPRPLPWRDVRRIVRPADMRRFSMRPGLTCLWQVRGRSEIGFDRWVQLDLEYIDRWSLALDLALLVRTIPAVFSGRGAT